MEPATAVTGVSWIARAYRSVRAYINIAQREAQLTQDRATLERDRAALALLVEKDAEIRHSPTRGITLAVGYPLIGRWTSGTSLRLPLQIIVQNTWIHPVTLTGLGGEVRYAAGARCEIPETARQFPVDGLSARAIDRTIELPITERHQQDAVIAPEEPGLFSFAVWVWVQCTDGTGTFTVEQELAATAMLRGTEPGE